MVPQPCDTSCDKDGRLFSGILAHRLEQLAHRSRDSLLARKGAVVHDDGGTVRRPAVAHQCFEDAGQLLRAGVAHHGAFETRKACPVDVGHGAAFILESANQGDRVAAARIGDRHTSVRGHGEARDHAGHDFEWHSVLVQEQGFLAPPIEHERVAPLEARNQLPVAGFLDQQVADGFLLHGSR